MIEMDAKRIKEEKKKAKSYIYIGETNRSVYERGLEHLTMTSQHARHLATC